MTKLNIIKLKATTNGRRHQVNLATSNLLQNPGLIKTLLKKKDAHYGRSSLFGKITSWHKQRGAKRLYRELDNKFKLGVVIGICYDPNRNGLISLNFDLSSKKFYYNLCPNNTYPGMITQNLSEQFFQKVGNRMKIKVMTPGTILHNVGDEKKSTYAKAAGTQITLINIIEGKAKVKMPSGEVKVISADFFGTIGKVSNSGFYLRSIGKAGRNRHKGRRPIVRGIAMNPVDHPHGGRTNGGMPSVTPWGLPTKGGFTLRKKK